jgi:hypothetical protein
MLLPFYCFLLMKIDVLLAVLALVQVLLRSSISRRHLELLLLVGTYLEAATGSGATREVKGDWGGDTGTPATGDGTGNWRSCMIWDAVGCTGTGVWISVATGGTGDWSGAGNAAGALGATGWYGCAACLRRRRRVS